MDESYIKNFYHHAMKYGTYLGAIWAIMYILLFKSYTSQFFSMAAIVLFFASPLIACRLAINFNRNECEGCMNYSKAWLLLSCMYICATLFSALTNYIFLNIIDQGALLMEINDALTQIISSPTIGEDEKAASESMQDMVSRLTANDITWQLLSNNIYCSMISCAFIKRAPLWIFPHNTIFPRQTQERKLTHKCK